MQIFSTNHARLKREQRKPEKNDIWMETIFQWAIEAILERRCINVKGQEIRPKQRLVKYTEHWKVYKLVCWKYGFVYDVTDKVYTIITFLSKEDRLHIWDTKLNLNWWQYGKQLDE